MKTIIGTPSRFKRGVRLDYSTKWSEYVIRIWSPKKHERIGIKWDREVF